MRKTKNIIIGALLIVILIMGVGYSTFVTNLNINGQAEITGEWDVKITNIEVKNVSQGSDAGTPEFTNTSATFKAKLNKPGDVITYLITIKNAGTIDAKLANIIFKSDENNAIIYKTSEIETELNAKEETTLTITITYNKEITEIPQNTTNTITGIIEYVQK